VPTSRIDNLGDFVVCATAKRDKIPFLFSEAS